MATQLVEVAVSKALFERGVRSARKLGGQYLPQTRTWLIAADRPELGNLAAYGLYRVGAQGQPVAAPKVDPRRERLERLNAQVAILTDPQYVCTKTPAEVAAIVAERDALAAELAGEAAPTAPASTPTGAAPTATAPTPAAAPRGRWGRVGCPHWTRDQGCPLHGEACSGQ